MSKKTKTILSIVSLVLLLGGLILYWVVKADDAKAGLNFETALTANLDSMAIVDSAYVWYESRAELTHLMNDSIGIDSLANVVNVFQHNYLSEKGDTLPEVYFFTNTKDTTMVETFKDFIVGDKDMKGDTIKVTFVEAFKIMRESAYKKPESRHCVLRKEVGSKPANPQYIFGNDKAQIYVDAVTGAVSDINPAY